MQREAQDSFMARAADLDDVDIITFDAHLENLMVDAVGVVAMGGYNTFCEILSFDKRALLLPRTKPRLEQYIRTSRAEELGLVRMIDDAQAPDPAPDGRGAVQPAAAERAVGGHRSGSPERAGIRQCPGLQHRERPRPLSLPRPPDRLIQGRRK